jgi:hypothetical protein
MEHVELSQRLLFYSTKTLHELAHPQTLASAIAKRFDHARKDYAANDATSSVQRVADYRTEVGVSHAGGAT